MIDENDTMKTTMGWLELETFHQSLIISETMIQFPGMIWLVGWKETSVKIKTRLGRVKQNIDTEWHVFQFLHTIRFASNTL